ncbi:MAG: DUF1553 domain-containing protein [Mariniblastus sp.]|nr:DUF1553 domain-containing protein [Mariniblastus sp.]
MRTYFVLTWILGLGLSLSSTAADEIDFNRDIRPILSNKCFLCHGPDPDGLEAGLRLDLRESAISVLETEARAVVPGAPEESELITRIMAEDESFRMPPSEHGAGLTETEIGLFKQWIAQGAHYATHWSYEAPTRPSIPAEPDQDADWPKNAIDRFTLHRMHERGLRPAPQVDRYALARRVYLDLTGLPPTIEAVDQFVNDTDPQAYEKLVDGLLQRPTFGEHWARKWLDLARYADSAGYADDPPRTIWAYRDWVIQAYNDNMPFDQFTKEQLAGDLLAEPTEGQLIATAFHRNTLTNNEGGTQDEEFRNVAVVDRANTTMAVWMGTTMACAQCHTHKYDPITQEEYFQFFAILNNTQDADRRDESPVLQIYSDEQRQRQKEWKSRIASFETKLRQPTADLAAAQQQWERRLSVAPDWQTLRPSAVTRRSQLQAQILKEGQILVTSVAKQDEYLVEIPIEASSERVVQWSGFRLEAIPHAALGNHSGTSGGNFVVTGIQADVTPETLQSPVAQFVRITNLGKNQILSLAEVQVFQGDGNIALQGVATQHSTAFGGPAQYAIDGNTDGVFAHKSVTHTATVENPWWELDLGREQSIDKIVLWNRKEASNRLSNFSVELLDSNRQIVMTRQIDSHPDPSLVLPTDSKRSIAFKTAFADYEQADFEALDVLAGKKGPKDGWAIGGSVDLPHQLVLIPEQPLVVDEPARLRIRVQQDSPHSNHLLGHFRLSATADAVAIERSRVPAEILKLLDTPADQRSTEIRSQLASYYREQVAPGLQAEREGLAKAKSGLAALKPATSVPVLRERKGKRRETYLQYRGSYLDKGQEVEPGLPAVFHSLPEDQEIDRLALAEWLTHSDNPLTARVLVNRYWESLFGKGIVPTSEEFGSQGEMPSHPKLLDWLATELMQNGWNSKKLLRMIVTSATYQQSAAVRQEQLVSDPDNRWLARAPRVRLSAEMVRDQALFVSGLLSPKMFGPPVKPPQPSIGLKAAFGGSTDWQTSTGEDRYRRGIYTTWRRSNPYPSMATFDAPNREVCTVRRNSTNTPLQSLVTLNDPVYVEAAQALARLVLQQKMSDEERVALAFRRCLLRPPAKAEVAALVALLNDARADLSAEPEEANKLAADPLGPLPTGVQLMDAAAMTVVCNVLLNLDEIFLKR